MGKTIIVSNRLPVKIIHEDDSFYYVPSEGGLATGLSSIYKEGDNLWIGWPGENIKNAEEKKQITKDLKEENMIPVFLSKKLIENFYEGFSNDTIWPVFHYFLQYANFDHNLFDAYVEANQLFCDAIVEVAEDGDTIWIHDYQLLLLPKLFMTTSCFYFLEWYEKYCPMQELVFSSIFHFLLTKYLECCPGEKRYCAVCSALI